MDPKNAKTEIENALADLASSKYLQKDVRTAADYIALPRAERERKDWLWRRAYLVPNGLVMADGELTGDLPFCSEWDRFYDYVKKEYPVQAFFRVTVADWFDTIKRRVERRYYDTRDWLFPRQRWLLKGLPNHWQDKRSLSVDVLFKMIVHFVEVEDALNTINWESDPEHLAFKQGVVECYKWIKIGRTELTERISKELSEGVATRRKAAKEAGVHDHNIEWYNMVYGPHDQLEAQLEDTDTEMCVWIIKNRALLWT